MKLDTKREYYSVTHNSGELHITVEDIAELKAIIWKNFGLYRVISEEKITNMYNTLLDIEQAKGPDTRIKAAGIFFWDDLKQD